MSKITEAIINSTMVRAMSKLFEAEERRLNERIIQLNKENKALQGSQLDGFLYGAGYYIPRETIHQAQIGHSTKVALHERLVPAMEAHLKDRSMVLDEMRVIRQTLFKLISTCQTWIDVRNALPECVVTCIPELARIKRTEPPAQTIQDNPRTLRQYLKVLPTMEVYSAARLLY